MGPADDSSDKLNRFQEAFERGQQGDVNSFDLWLQDHDYIADRVNRDSVTQYFRENPERAANHETALETIGEYIGFATNQTGVYHLPIIGVTGIGKTQLLYTICSLLPEIDSDIEYRLFDASTLGNRQENRTELTIRAEEIEKLDHPIILLDDCHLDKRNNVSLDTFSTVTENALIVSTWSPEGYLFDREDIRDTLPPATELYLDPFSERDTVATIDTVLQYISENGVDLDDSVTHRIHELSHGIPRLAVLLVLHGLREAFMKELDPLSLASVDAAGRQLDLTGGLDRVRELSESKLNILRWILLALDERGRQPGELVDKLSRDKSTISYHLSTLKEENFVTAQNVGRKSYYRVNEPLKPLVQLHLIREAEFNA